MMHRSLVMGNIADFALLAALLVLAAVCPAGAQRLPNTVVPDHYTLTLTPDLKAATFKGVESIDATVKQPVRSITLNAAEIAFQSVTISAGGQEQTATVVLDKGRSKRRSTSLPLCRLGKPHCRLSTPGF